MARNFRRQRQSAPISELNVTNLIDLGFTLLIIFMIATPLINQEQTIPVDLPVESRSDQANPDPDTQFETITIRAGGTVDLAGTAIAMAGLKVALAPYAEQTKPPVFRIRMDADSTAQQFITVMDALKSQNLSRITFDTQVTDQ
ncbi:ExbD/TolR family protein [Synoicihabitans lomoniglobus]|uniref:Biopolymer transporter ExbD n=1 Tax=Synoicihabitans lomoniglobus TaxID=2909285 RepID=A0AAF0I7K4_9BACT|nr:biopolymer transporter ExbD [Opitutaceae bacterium LMO-M01]WED66811.1 biopolymer transporter ExbD [Opitutaceae bacterium LMO-M01]